MYDNKKVYKTNLHTYTYITKMINILFLCRHSQVEIENKVASFRSLLLRQVSSNNNNNNNTVIGKSKDREDSLDEKRDKSKRYEKYVSFAVF